MFNLLSFQVLRYKYNLISLVTYFLIPKSLQELFAFFSLDFSFTPMLSRNLAPPWLVELIVNSCTCFLDSKWKSWVISKPKKAFSSSNLIPKWIIFGSINQFKKFVRLKWPSGFIYKRRNIIFDSFGDVLNFFFFQNPFLILFCCLKIKSFHWYQIFKIYFWVWSSYHLRIRIYWF